MPRHLVRAISNQRRLYADLDRRIRRYDWHIRLALGRISYFNYWLQPHRFLTPIRRDRMQRMRRLLELRVQRFRRERYQLVLLRGRAYASMSFNRVLNNRLYQRRRLFYG